LLSQIIGMSVIYILITVSILVAIVFLIAFIKAVRSGQYDDDYTPSVRMLFDDELIKSTKELTKTDNKIN
jgi:cbb3-type cytochrome oxidase maturation protein